MSAKVQWLTTGVNERYAHKTHGADQGQRGWRLHAVLANPKETVAAVSRLRSLCGLLPRHGWALDMFIDRRCERCERAAARLSR